MNPLAEDLQVPKRSLDEFVAITQRVLDFLPNVVSDRAEARGYALLSSTAAGVTKFTRPVNTSLFIFERDEFAESSKRFLEIISGAKRNRTRGHCRKEHYTVVDRVVYTIQQAIGIGLDLLCNPNSARKHVGNRFEELIRLVIAETGVANRKVVIKIPYTADSTYSCETDLVFSPFDKVRSTSETIHPAEVVVSLKTSSKDRMGKIFLDKLLMQRFVEHNVKVVGIFLNDVQRKGHRNISYTFLSGLFMVYTKFLTELEGVYFVDMPPKTRDAPYKELISSFSKFLLEDMWRLID